MLPLTFDDGSWYVGDSNRSSEDGMLILHVDELAEVTIAELEDLFAQITLKHDPSVGVYTGNIANLDPDLVGVSRVGFVTLESRIVAVVSFGLPWPQEEHDQAFQVQESDVQVLIAPLIARSETVVRDFTTAPYGYELGIEHPYLQSGQYPSRIMLESSAGAGTLRELFAVGDNLVRLIDAYLGDAPTRDTVADLIRAGRADLLVGLSESSWLDMKIQEYAPDDALASYKMAVEVAAFCNAEDGGIIVIGGATDGGANRNGGEIITAVDGLHRVRKSPRAYLASLRDLIFPPPADLRVEVIELPSSAPILLVDIPAQSDEQKPFLVRRAIGLRDGKTDSRGFTIAQRRGEDTVYLDAASLHAQIAAGRALLKRGIIPDDNG